MYKKRFNEVTESIKHLEKTVSECALLSKEIADRCAKIRNSTCQNIYDYKKD